MPRIDSFLFNKVVHHVSSAKSSCFEQRRVSVRVSHHWIGPLLHQEVEQRFAIHNYGVVQHSVLRVDVDWVVDGDQLAEDYRF